MPAIRHRITATLRSCMLSVALAATVAAGGCASRHHSMGAQEIIDMSAATVDRFRDGPHGAQVRALLRETAGVMVFPDLNKTGFGIGGEYGIGVLLVGNVIDGFSEPAFFKAYSGTIGLQFGFQEAEAMLFLMRPWAVDQVLATNVELGIDASLVALSDGPDAETSSRTLPVDIYYLARSRSGLYAGLNLENMVVTPSDAMQRVYYDREFSAREIVMLDIAANPEAAPLHDALVPPILYGDTNPDGPNPLPADGEVRPEDYADVLPSGGGMDDGTDE